jgi:metallo-beta-lactamase family protein
MKLIFLGANRCVTGSRYCLEVNGTRVMIDCGLVQERQYVKRNWEPSPIKASSVQALLLTHVHIDHSGLIPKFVQEGFSGPILATHPTVDLASIVLRDSAHIQKEDAAYKKKRHRREGRQVVHPEEPLYRTADVERSLSLFQGVDYDRMVPVADGINVLFRDAGHILGSAMLELLVKEGNTERRLVFSGDIGQRGKPLIKDPSVFEQADYVVMESTYGDRLHEKSGDIETQLCDVINQTLDRQGNVVIPTFAIERAQELMFYIGRLVYAKRIPKVSIFLDSPMAVDVTEIFRAHRQYLDSESRSLVLSNEPPLRYPGLQMVQTAEQSRALNHLQRPSIIMSPSGMCTAGRIKHHLRHNIGRPESTILFAGFQARGTLGRQILEGNQEVRIHGALRRVKAQVAHINGLSGHADQAGLLDWLSHLQTPPRHVFLAHGEEAASECLAGLIQDRWGWPVSIPAYESAVNLD